MTTKFLDNNICTFKILLSCRFPWKTAFWDTSPLYPRPTPLKSAKCIFIVVSQSLKINQGIQKKQGKEGQGCVTLDVLNRGSQRFQIARFEPQGQNPFESLSLLLSWKRPKGTLPKGTGGKV